MKKIFCMLAVMIALMLMIFTVSAYEVGDVVGYTRYTDIVASINNHNIASFNIDGYTGVVAEDLRNYGFDVNWVPEERALYISRGATNAVQSNYVAQKLSAAVLGTKAQDILYTDIKCYINGNFVQSYNINGQTIILFNDLSCFGEVSYDNNTRKLDLTVNDGLVFRSNDWYTNLPKITMYAEFGKTMEVYQHEAAAYADVGWFYQPVIPITEPTNDSILPFCFGKNSVDGIKLCWTAKNVSGKTINYYTVRVYFYNSVGDPAYDEITHKSFKDVKYVGPVAPDAELVIFSMVGYVPACSKVTLGEITLEYSDGTTDKFWYGWNTSTRRDL